MQHTVQKAQAGQIRAREIANVAYGAAGCQRCGALSLLFAALARAVETRLSEFNPQSVANTAWGFATASHCDQQLFAALARAAEWRLSEFDPQELANTAWALGIVNHRDQ